MEPMTASPSPTLTEARMVDLARNALLVAGTEMGTTGDHWPVINATIHSIMKDWEDLQTERAVHAEMKKHLYAQLDAMDRLLPTCAPEVQAEVAPQLRELRAIYDAFFAEADETKLTFDPADVPMHVKRAQAIIRTLEEEDA